MTFYSSEEVIITRSSYGGFSVYFSPNYKISQLLDKIDQFDFLLKRSSYLLLIYPENQNSEIKSLNLSLPVENVHYFPIARVEEVKTKMDVFSTTEKPTLQLVFGFSDKELIQISRVLDYTSYGTVLETNLSTIATNIQTMIPDGQEKVMAMVKADAYGSGVDVVSTFLHGQGVNYFGVATADEGREIRAILPDSPVMVIASGVGDLPTMIQHELEPVLYDRQMIRAAEAAAIESGIDSFRVHIELDTGMHRLGFTEDDLDDLVTEIKSSSHLKIVSVFSHLAASDDPKEDDFTQGQRETYARMAKVISDRLNVCPLLHIDNSHGVIAFDHEQLDLVRLGIAMYGYSDRDPEMGVLKGAHVFRSKILQTKPIPAKETIGYNRTATMSSDGKIAVIQAGYADGVSRLLNNQNYEVTIQGKKYPIIGNVCMDLTMVDISISDEISTGTEILFWFDRESMNAVAEVCQTIPYEILTSISPRVKRIYRLLLSRRDTSNH